jgi:hypothetical protein
MGCRVARGTTIPMGEPRGTNRRAALPRDRMNALMRFHDRGIFTWVSLEPTLDIESSLAKRGRDLALMWTCTRSAASTRQSYTLKIRCEFRNTIEAQRVSELRSGAIPKIP